MTDLIARLRKMRPVVEMLLLDEAADALEAAQAEIERLREELNVTRLQRDAKLSSQTAVDEAATRENERLRKLMDVQARRLRTVMRNEPIASWELRCDVADVLALAATGEIESDES